MSTYLRTYVSKLGLRYKHIVNSLRICWQSLLQVNICQSELNKDLSTYMYVIHSTYSLSKCSNYPNSIHEILAMSQNSIREILAMSSKKYFQLINFLSNFSSIHEKIQTPWTIQFYVVKNTSMKIFLWSKKHKFLNLAMFSKNIEKFWDIAKISRILFG